MVKLTGPSLAQTAAGTLGDQLTFQKLGRRSYARKKPQPKNPKTAPQISMRTIMQFLATQWSKISTNDRYSWHDLATQSNIPDYNAYLAHNLERWRNHKPPSQAYPAAEEDGGYSIANIQAIGHVRRVLLRAYINSVGNGWWIAIHRQTTSPVSPQWNNLVIGWPINTGAWNETWDVNLKPGRYYYRLQEHTKTGKKEYIMGQIFADVT